MIAHADLADIAACVYRGPWSGIVAGDVRHALLPRGREIVVALPGTHPREALDWLRDIRFWPARVRGLGPVHAGFGLGANAAWRQMAPELGVTHEIVTFTGHSLGGALALCLAAIHAYERPGAPFRVVTFGAPRPAFLNPWFRARLARGVERVLYRRRGDVVPDVPWPLYGHGARQTTIGRDLGEPIANHAIAQYARDLRGL
jgi:hypothetical protein